MYLDYTYIFVIIGAIISAIASWNVSATYKRYNKFANSKGVTAEEVAKRILESAGITDVRVERVRGNLTDHYSPREKVLRLSDSVYGSTSIAALGVAAHECGHAVQHKEKYKMLGLRSISVPFANIGSNLSWPVILIGLVLGNDMLAMVGVMLFVAVVIFELLTLPVEFDASSRALKILERDNMLVGEELGGARKVLSAAALTYVASLFATILQLIRLILIVRRNDEEE